jgi:hypothetical protein
MLYLDGFTVHEPACSSGEAESPRHCGTRFTVGGGNLTSGSAAPTPSARHSPFNCPRPTRRGGSPSAQPLAWEAAWSALYDALFTKPVSTVT